MNWELIGAICLLILWFSFCGFCIYAAFDTSWKMGVIAIVFFGIITLGTYACIQVEHKKELSCEAVGGNYQVVRKEMSPRYDVNLKITVYDEIDIYGCVK